MGLQGREEGKKTKSVQEELEESISWPMTYSQNEGRVPAQDLRSTRELSPHHSTLSVPYFWEYQ